MADMSPTNETERGSTSLRVGVKGLITEGGRVLITHERRSDGSRFWTLPGGGLRQGESFDEGLRREIEEEIQSKATIGSRVTTCAYHHKSAPQTVTIYQISTCAIEDTPRPNRTEGIIGCRWVDPQHLPATMLDPFRQLLETREMRREIKTTSEVPNPTGKPSVVRSVTSRRVQE